MVSSVLSNNIVAINKKRRSQSTSQQCILPRRQRTHQEYCPLLSVRDQVGRCFVHLAGSAAGLHDVIDIDQAVLCFSHGC